MEECKTFRQECEEAAGREGLSASARRHASACEGCGEYVREREALRKLVGGLARVEAPADFDQRLRARMAASRGGDGGGSLSRFFFSPGLAWVAAAACFLAVSTTLYFRQSHTPHASEPNGGAAQVKGGGADAQSVEALTASNAQRAEGVTTVVQKDSEEAAAKDAVRAPKSLRRIKFAEAPRRPNSSAVYSLTGASVKHRSEAEVAGRQPIAIPVRTSPDSLRLVVRDARGTRPVSVRAVSFGSQELVAGVGSRKGMPAVEKSGVW